jgi:hypothetical protein
MRRLVLVLGITFAVLGAGFWIPAAARPSTGPTDALTGGRATIVVSADPYGFPDWTLTLDGQLAAGGRTYTGTATGTDMQDYPFGYFLGFSGTSATGSITGSCLATTGPDARPIVGYGVPRDVAPAGVLDAQCSVSIDGAPLVGLELILAMAPTADPKTFTGVYGAVPDTTSTPTVPLISFGTAGASTFYYSFANIGFGFNGQISLGGNTFRGLAGGGTNDFGSGPIPLVMHVGPFALTGSSLTGSLSATCTGLFVGVPDTGFVSLGPGLSILSCDGSANGGSTGHVTLVSAYPIGATVQQPKGYGVNYTGIFVGI